MKLRTLFAVSALSAAMLFAACSGDGHDQQSSQGQGQHANGESRQGGHDEEGQQSQGQQGEESATQYDRSDTYDHTRNGVRLILNYDETVNAFVGTVANTTGDLLTRVRVEVHLSNGTELGPTTPEDLAPGEKLDITLPATEAPFETWSAHPEVGSEEANHQSDRE